MNRFFLLISAFAALLATAQTRSTMFPPVRGTREMVAAANNQEVEAGYRILTQGGNAVDAGVATVLAAAVTEQSRFGLGGEIPVLIKPRGQPVAAISGIGVAPAKATISFFRSRSPEPWEDPFGRSAIPAAGLLAAPVPGAFDGLILALDRYGTMSFAQVAAPAIEDARGFPIGDEFANLLRGYEDILHLWPPSYKFFFPSGEPPGRGALVRYLDLERTLSELVDVENRTKGTRTEKLTAVRDYFYQGPLARRMAAFSAGNGGLLTYDDFAHFRAEIDQPRSTTYRGYEVLKPGFWTQGPVMLEALNILEGYDLKSMGHNSADYLHTLIEALKLAFADRDAYYGDPKFSEIPEAALLSRDYAAARRKLIDPQHASLEHRPGEIAIPGHMSAGIAGPTLVQDTTCVNVVDRNGNLFSATPSGAWLPSVIAGDTGIPFSTRLQSFVLDEGHANQLHPGKRPRVTLSPTLVLKDSKPFLALSTPGGDNQDQALLQVFLNIVEFGMNPQEAVEAPRFQSDHFYSSFARHEFLPGKLSVENRIPADTVEKLRLLGHRVTTQRDWGNGAAPTVIEINNGVLEGGADPRRARFVFGR